MRLPVASFIAVLFAAQTLAAPHFARESNDLTIPRRSQVDARKIGAAKRPTPKPALKPKPVVKGPPKQAAKPPPPKKTTAAAKTTQATKATTAAAAPTPDSNAGSSGTGIGSQIAQAAGDAVTGTVAGEIAGLGSTIGTDGTAVNGTQTADDGSTATDDGSVADDGSDADDDGTDSADEADDGETDDSEDGTIDNPSTLDNAGSGAATDSDTDPDTASTDSDTADATAANSTALGTSPGRTRKCDQGDQSLAAAMSSAVTVGLGLQAATATLQNSTDFTTDLARLAQFSKTMGFAVQMASAIADDDSLAQPQLKLLVDAQTKADAAIAGLKQGDDLTGLAQAFEATTNNAQDGAVQALIDCSLPLSTISG